MTAPLAPQAASETTLGRLAAEIRNNHRGHLRELRIEAACGGVVLHGRAGTFYGKQLALHEVLRRGGVVVVANRITVESPTVCQHPDLNHIS